MSERRSNTPVAIIVVAVIAFLAIGVWWIEDRFDSTVAIVVVGGLFGVVCLTIGYLMNLASTKATLAAAADFNHDLAGVERYRQQAFKEFARAESQLRVLDARRVDQIAQQRAGLLMDVERQKNQPAQLWDDSDVLYEEVG